MFQMFLVSFQVTHLADPKRTNTQKISTKTQKQNKITNNNAKQHDNKKDFYGKKTVFNYNIKKIFQNS